MRARSTVCVHDECALRNVCAVHVSANTWTVESPREMRPHLTGFKCSDFVERKRSDA
jgi:hypothetical protein